MAMKGAGPQVTDTLDCTLHSTTELLLDKYLSLNKKNQGISKMEMKHNLIPINVNIKPNLAIQEVLKNHMYTITNQERLSKEVENFHQVAKSIQITQSKLELKHMQENMHIHFCREFQHIVKTIIAYIQVQYNIDTLDNLHLNKAARVTLYMSLVHILNDNHIIFKYPHTSKQDTLKSNH